MQCQTVPIACRLDFDFPQNDLRNVSLPLRRDDLNAPRSYFDRFRLNGLNFTLFLWEVRPRSFFACRWERVRLYYNTVRNATPTWFSHSLDSRDWDERSSWCRIVVLKVGWLFERSIAYKESYGKGFNEKWTRIFITVNPDLLLHINVSSVDLLLRLTLDEAQWRN